MLIYKGLGKHTSTIDWCELNYSVTPYVAEFVNTLTNLPTVLLGLYGAWVAYNGGLKNRYLACYLGLSLIGLGSFGFHMSLRWEWQLMDELPMIYVVSYAAYLSLDTLPSFKPRFGLWGPLSMLAWDFFVTFSYIYLPNPIYHEIAFASILFTTLFRSVSLIRRLPSDHHTRPFVTRTMLVGSAVFALGFGVWNVDNIFCVQLRKIRGYMGVYGFLLEAVGVLRWTDVALA
ncbi:dihydroceramidase [Tremella mesenterica]|uniref:Dihydroceramidase n=1 Tax=Tremella mesenterica TaxID=5217 RepID=A0A4Q1BUA1_TREME|nr:dihydroceramidase [Tremella mesenterica]